MLLVQQSWIQASLAIVLSATCAMPGLGCGDGAVTGDVAVERCETACNALKACGTITSLEGELCASRCGSDPMTAQIDLDEADCVDDTPSCDCVSHSSLAYRSSLTLGVFPGARQLDGRLVRQCGLGPIHGLVVDSVIIGEGTNGLVRGIVPDSVVSFSPVAPNVSQFLALQIRCLEPAMRFDELCATDTQIEASIQGSVFVSGQQEIARRVVIVVDQSGSTSGLVDTDRQYRESSGSFRAPSDSFMLASDPFSSRVGEVRHILRVLGPSYDVCVLGATDAEGGVIVPSPGTRSPVDDKTLRDCFDGGDHSRWFDDDGGLNRLAGTGSGRAPLWSVIGIALEMLRSRSDHEASNHILVLSDGPDTCSGEARTDCESVCITGAVGVEDIVGQIEREPKTPPRIDFIQFTSLGYRERDFRQVRVACASGGQYIFIDSVAGPEALGIQLRASLEALVASWDGVWRFYVGAGESGDLPAIGEVPAGVPYALRGSLEVNAVFGELQVEQAYSFDIAEFDESLPIGTTWDRRLVVSTRCGSDSDCSSQPITEDGCAYSCSTETGLCAAASSGESRPDGLTCPNGMCCGGVCSSEGECCAGGSGP